MHDQTYLNELVDIVGGFELTINTLLNRILDAPVAPSTEALAEIMHLLLMALPAVSYPLRGALARIERLESDVRVAAAESRPATAGLSRYAMPVSVAPHIES